MDPFNLIITDIITIREDIIYKDKPYIPNIPRDDMAIVLITEGVLVYTVRDTTYRTKAGNIFVILDGDIDISASEGNYVRYLFIVFRSRSKLMFSPNSIDRINPIENFNSYETLFRETIDIWNSRGFTYISKCRELLYTIINRVVTENYAKTESYYKYNKIRSAIAKIETDFAADINTTCLAEMCSMSTGNLSRIFIEIFGMTPTQYLSKTRIENAKRLLLLGAYSITEIAQCCGYADIYTFSRAFRRACGISPSQFK